MKGPVRLGLRRALGAVAALLVVSPAVGAGPSAPARRGGRLHLGLRTGFGLPLGKYADVQSLAGVRDEDNAIGDDTHGVIPLWLDVGYRLDERLMLGAYVVYGVVLPKTAPSNDPLGGGCPEGMDCFASGVRFGVQAQYSFAPGAPLNPWLGVAVGYEWINSQLEGELLSFPFEASTTYSGPDLLQLQAGADVRLAGPFSLGPFVAGSAMRYTRCSLTLGGEESRCELPDGGWHGWLVFGVRGIVEL